MNFLEIVGVVALVIATVSIVVGGALGLN